MTNSSSTANVQENFLEKLKRLYWAATQREVGSMILFYNKVQRCTWDEERHKENENKNLEKILHLWSNNSSIQTFVHVESNKLQLGDRRKIQSHSTRPF